MDRNRSPLFRRGSESDTPIAPGAILNTMQGNRCSRRLAMPLNTDKIDDDCRAWKGMDWDVLGRLHDKGMIHDPVGKVKSVVFAQEGLQRAKAQFKEMFET